MPGVEGLVGKTARATGGAKPLIPFSSAESLTFPSAGTKRSDVQVVKRARARFERQRLACELQQRANLRLGGEDEDETGRDGTSPTACRTPSQRRSPQVSRAFAGGNRNRPCSTGGDDA